MKLQANNTILLPPASVPGFLGNDVSADGTPEISVVRHVYKAMLLSFSAPQIGRFLDRIPVERNGVVLDAFRKIQLLCDPEMPVPVEVARRIFGALEEFCADERIDFDEFVKTFYSGVHPWRFFSAEAWLALVNPHLGDMLAAPDRREFLLERFERLSRTFFPHSTNELIEIRPGKTSSEAWFLFDADEPTGIPFDVSRWFCPWLRHLPEVFGMPPYEELDLMADVLPAETLLPGLEIRGKKAFWKGSEVGAVKAFSAVAKSFGLPMRDPLDVDSPVVVLAEKLPKGVPPRVRPGCCCGAPVYLARIRYAPFPAKKGPANPLKLLVEGLLSEDKKTARRIDALHSALLQSISAKTEVVYHSVDDSVTINGEHFIRNVPAKIFRRVLKTYLLTGRTTFENREFKRDAEITLDVSNPNFEGRLNRLMARLEESHPELIIVRRRRGEFVFAPKCAISFHEE